MSFPHLILVSFFYLLPISLSQPPRSLYIDCGASVSTEFNGYQWQPDGAFVSAGSSKAVLTPDVLSILSTVRSFAYVGNLNKKFCYQIPVFRFAKYLVRTTYFYGGVNGKGAPPVFDQMVDGTFWSVVDTAADYAQNMSSYYEGVFKATGKVMSICLGVNSYTDSDPFISAIEMIMLWDSVYNSTDFDKFALSLVSRHSFGYDGPLIRYPDDQFDRFWQPFGPPSSVTRDHNASVGEFWNLPPAKVFQTRLTANNTEPWSLQWPLGPIPNSTYYIALYFANDHTSSSGSSRVFNISINGVPYYSNLNVTPLGVDVFANQWPLVGLTSIKLTPVAGSDFSPLINAGEMFNILPLGRRTITRDVIALINVKRSLQMPPSDWNGDPCLPAGYSWTGVTCSVGPQIRIVSLNLMNMGLSGYLSPLVANLTAVNSILLGNNHLSGPIPDLRNLRHLQILGLEKNQFNGTIPTSLGEMKSLRVLHLEYNNLSGRVPSTLLGKPGLNFTFSPGNNFMPPSPAQATKF